MVELISVTHKAERVIEFAGRTCYNSLDKISEDSHVGFIRNAINRQHFGILEHASASFKITSVSRSFTHQLVRHRLASYCQMSQRYVDQEDFKYITPESIAKDDFTLALYKSTMVDINNAYNKLRVAGIKKEDARFILPEACETEIIMTANFREFRNILELRCSPHAQWEIRNVCDEILMYLNKEAPNCFFDLAEKYLVIPE